MAMTITKADAKRFQTKYESLRGRIDRIKEKAESKVGEAVYAAEVVGSAFVTGLVEGRTGGIEIFNIPMPLLAGVAGLGLGLLDVAGKASSHVTAVGTGALAAYAATMGRGVGQEWKAKAPAAVKVSGYEFEGLNQAGTLSGGGLTPTEILIAQRQGAMAL